MLLTIASAVKIWISLPQALSCDDLNFRLRMAVNTDSALTMYTFYTGIGNSKLKWYRKFQKFRNWPITSFKYDEFGLSTVPKFG